MKERLQQLTNYSFGSTSAIITIISLIVGLGSGNVSRSGIIGSILVIAIADNISDSLGIHIYKESELCSVKDTLIATIGNFTARLIISSSFILITLLLPILQAQISAVLWGMLLLSFISYRISKENGKNTMLEILKHITVAMVVIAASKYIGSMIRSRF